MTASFIFPIINSTQPLSLCRAPDREPSSWNNLPDVCQRGHSLQCVGRWMASFRRWLTSPDPPHPGSCRCFVRGPGLLSSNHTLHRVIYQLILSFDDRKSYLCGCQSRFPSRERSGVSANQTVYLTFTKRAVCWIIWRRQVSREAQWANWKC